MRVQYALHLEPDGSSARLEGKRPGAYLDYERIAATSPNNDVLVEGFFEHPACEEARSAQHRARQRRRRPD